MQTISEINTSNIQARRVLDMDKIKTPPMPVIEGVRNSIEAITTTHNPRIRTIPRLHVDLTTWPQIPSGRTLPHNYSPPLIRARTMPPHASRPHLYHPQHSHIALWRSKPHHTIPRKSRRLRHRPNLAHTRSAEAGMAIALCPPCQTPGRAPTTYRTLVTPRHGVLLVCILARARVGITNWRSGGCRVLSSMRTAHPRTKTVSPWGPPPRPWCLESDR